MRGQRRPTTPKYRGAMASPPIVPAGTLHPRRHRAGDEPVSDRGSLRHEQDDNPRAMARMPKLEPIAPRVWLLRGGLTRTMNAYLIEDGDGIVVYDTGEKGMAPAIAGAAQR